MSMATGEYVSVSSQADTENAALAQEQKELETDYQGEVRELTSLYIQRGVEPTIAHQVAEQLMVKDALDAHAREELGLTGTNSAQPLQAAIFSALSFSAGAPLPLIVAWLSPAKLVVSFIIFSTLFSLAALGYISSIVSKAPPVRAIIRITFWSTMAMVLSMGVGHLAGRALL
jgi:VIT1/CCC1 family predicted Fe2+/Mn2+ transporter